MRKCLVWVPAIFFAGAVLAQDGRPDPRHAKAKAPAVEYRSAFEGYRPYVDAEPRDWRRANEEVGSTGGHAGHKPGQGPGMHTGKPQPGSPEASGHGGHR